jgi:hypothetical protein
MTGHHRQPGGLVPALPRLDVKMTDPRLDDFDQDFARLIQFDHALLGDEILAEFL